MLINIILIIIIAIVAVGAGIYLYKAKKRGEHCIGCPYAKQCSKTKSNCISQK